MKKKQSVDLSQHFTIVLGAIALTALILSFGTLIARDPSLRQADRSSAIAQIPEPTCKPGPNGEKSCTTPNPTDKEPQPTTPPIGGGNNSGGNNGGSNNGGGGSTNVSNADRTITLDRTIVNVTLDRKNAIKGIVYGAGFSIRSNGATIWNIKYKNPVRGVGFDKTASVIAPGASTTLRTAINTSVPNGTYRGEAVVEYFKNNRWNQGPSVFYTITLGGTNVVSTATTKPIFSPTTKGSMVKVYAAGIAGRGIYPDMHIVVNDKVVKTFYGVQGNPLIRDFLEFAYSHTAKITPDQLKLKFINDFDDKQANDDRNLVIDKVEIDGYEYETEGVNTFSTGTWTNADGCAAGKKSSEWLMCNGYVQY